MNRAACLLAGLLLAAPRLHATPTGGGFAAGDLYMNALAMPGTPAGGLVRLDPFGGPPQVVLQWLSSNVADNGASACCYDPGRDRILVFGNLDGQLGALWAVDAAGNHVKVPTTVGAVRSLAPATDGKVYAALAIFSSNPSGVLGWIDPAGAYHPLLDANGFLYSPFAGIVQVAGAAIAYDPPTHTLLYAVQHAGGECVGTAGSTKGALYQISLSADGTRAIGQSCQIFEIDGGYPFGTQGGVPVSFSRTSSGSYLLVLRGNGPNGSDDEQAPRMKIVTANLFGITTYASNGPYSNAGWCTAGTWSSLRHDAVIFDAAGNELRAFGLGQIGAGTVLDAGLVGGVNAMERAGLIEIAPLVGADGQIAGTPAQVSLATGGTQTLSIDFGPAYAGRKYAVLGSASGFNPGLKLQGHPIPLNLDSYTLLTLQNPNSLLLMNSFGTLGPAGTAQTIFGLPPGLPPALAGLVLHHAALAASPPFAILGVSNAAPVKLVP
jgi:hypothetical protein